MRGDKLRPSAWMIVGPKIEVKVAPHGSAPLAGAIPVSRGPFRWVSLTTLVSQIPTTEGHASVPQEGTSEIDQPQNTSMSRTALRLYEAPWGLSTGDIPKPTDEQHR